MPRSPVVIRLAACAALALASLLPSPAEAASVLAKPGDPPPGPRPSLHVSFAVGWVAPMDWPGLEDGHVLALRLANDNSPRLTSFAEIQVGSVRGTVKRPYWALPGSYFHERVVQSYTTLTVGSRFHVLRTSVVRPFLEAGASVRFAEDGSGSYSTTYWEGRFSGIEQDGACGLVRAGFSTAPLDGAGLWIDAGWEFVLRNPGDRGMLPVRLGIRLF